MSASARLAELGLKLPEVTPPVGSYVPALKTGSFVFTSGQLPFVTGELIATGAVGHGPRDISPEYAQECARIAAINALAAAADAAGGIDNIVRIIKVVGFVASNADFYGQPAVINGASNLFVDVFGEAGRHARSAVGVASLPLGAPVEVELIVEIAANEG